MGKNTFVRLREDSPLVKKLLTEKWWKEIVALSHTDRNINIQLWSHSINVYSKMGNMLRISLQGKEICCEVHYKYLIAELKSPYVKILPGQGELKVSDDACPNVRNIIKDIKTVQTNIAVYAGEGKAIQSKLVEKNKETIVDVEVAAFSGESENDDKEDKTDNTRIDLVNFDKKIKKLVFIELKQIFDSRLYSNEINKQIKKYHDFAIKNEGRIIEAYQDAIKTKKKLGIIRDKSYLAKVEISAIEPRPLLVIAGFNQNVIDGLKDKIICHLQESIEKKRLAGLYFFGKDVDLNLTKQKNKILF